jgi:hypothetical protein
MLERPFTAYIIMVLLFILPQSLYTIGDYMAVGIRFPLFRYQHSVYGPSFIPVTGEVGYIASGIIKWTTPAGTPNPTAIASWIWLSGLAVLFAAAALILSWHLLNNPDHARFPGPLIILAGFLFLAWAMVQYGPFFSGPSGYSVPVGVPILWYCGYQFMQAAKGEDA